VQFLPIFVFPQILLGGIFIPREQLPEGLEAISDWLPLSYAIDALQAVADDSESLEWILANLLVLSAWIVGCIVVGSITLRRRTA
jgi:ABC-2 type transport system permease protein